MASTQTPPAVSEAESEPSPEFEASPGESGSPDVIGTLSRGPVFTSMVEDAMDSNRPLEPSKCPKRCTPEVKALLLSACLFSTITSFQVWAAHLAKSRALLMDCISSAVDALTFIGNIGVECRKRDGRRHACSQLMVVATSLGLLTFFTIRAMGKSYGAVLVCQAHGRNSEDDDDDVNGWILLGFALGNMLFDIICLVNFLKSHKQTGSGKHANMFSAFLHVGADFLRAFTALVLSLLVLICTSWDSTCLDAYCSLVIGVTILCGVLVGLWKWICLLLSLLLRDE